MQDIKNLPTKASKRLLASHGVRLSWITDRQHFRNAMIKLAVVVGLCLYLLSADILHLGNFFNVEAKSRARNGRQGAVSTEMAACSQIGIDIMRQGGNAADAAVASTLCVGVMGMYHSGIGGGGFAIIRSSKGSYETIDFREEAPSSARENMFKHRLPDSVYGGLASGVPGEIKGLEYIHQKYGILPWEAVVAPAVHIARDGFIVGEDLERRIHEAVAQMPDEYDFFTKDPSWSLDFAPDGKRVSAGDRMFRKRYANTLERIARGGSDVFYHGQIARDLVSTIIDNNGSMTIDDLARYSVRPMATSNITYRGHRLYSTTSPSSGAIALSALKILENYKDIFRRSTEQQSTHLLIEAMKFAYAHRALLGDPLFVSGMDEYQQRILSSDFAENIRRRISDNRTLDVSDYNPDQLEMPASHGTSHISTADHTGLSISLTTTINLGFGSKLMDHATGIILNNVMDDFSIPGVSNSYGYIPSEANFIRPMKRPLSSTAPVIVEDADGNLELVIGAAGGSRIISSVIQSIIHVLDQNMSITESLAHPRLHDQLSPSETGLEVGYSPDTIAFLETCGHNVTVLPSTLSAAQGIFRRPDGLFQAASEPRQKDSKGISF